MAILSSNLHDGLLCRASAQDKHAQVEVNPIDLGNMVVLRVYHYTCTVRAMGIVNVGEVDC